MFKQCKVWVHILNWLGVEAYPVYDNLPITEAQKQDPNQLLAAFEKYFNPERNIFYHILPWDPSIVELLKLSQSSTIN